MRNTRRIKRMSRNRLKITKMNLTSLMDVFTILVFFLLVNSGSVEVMETPKNMTLPEARVETKPRETVVIFVSPEDVLVQGRIVAHVADILEGELSTVEPITTRLAELRDNIVGPSTLSRGRQPGDYDIGRQVGAVHRDQKDHVRLHGRGLRKRLSGRYPERIASRGALAPKG